MSLSDNGNGITGIKSDKIHKVWTQVTPFIDSAINYSNGKISLDYVKEQLISRDWQLWISVDNWKIAGCAITEFVQQENQSTCIIRLAGGDHTHDWLQYHNLIEAWAKHNGASFMEIYGRVGWERYLRKQGYKATRVVLEKRI